MFQLLLGTVQSFKPSYIVLQHKRKETKLLPYSNFYLFSFPFSFSHSMYKLKEVKNSYVIMGLIPKPHQPLKSSSSIAQFIAPRQPFSRIQSTLIFRLSGSSYPIHWSPREKGDFSIRTESQQCILQCETMIVLLLFNHQFL